MTMVVPEVNRCQNARNCSGTLAIRGNSRSAEVEATMKHLLRAALVAAFVLGASFGVHAQTETTLIAPGGIRAPLDDLVPRYEKKTGQKVKATYGSGGGTRKQVVSGEAFDVPVIQLPDSDVLASGQVIAGSARPLASVAVGV